MKKTVALMLTSLLMLTALMTLPLYVPQSSAPEVKKWKITLAQKNCNAEAIGYLTDQYHDPIVCTGFCLKCVCGGFVYTKVDSVQPYDIHFLLSVDWDKDGVPDQEDMLDLPIVPGEKFQFEKEIIWNITLMALGTVNPAAPECTMWEDISVPPPPMPHLYHLQHWQDNGDGNLSHCDYVWLNMTQPPVNCSLQEYHVEQVIPAPPAPTTTLLVSQKKMVVVEVEEMEVQPTHEWQVTLISKPNVTAMFVGVLTKNGLPLAGTNFNLTTYWAYTPLTWYNLTLSQVDCNAKINGTLTKNGKVISFPFSATCKENSTSTQIAIDPTLKPPNDIHFTLRVDWDKNGIYEDVQQHKFNSTSSPPFAIPFSWTKTNGSKSVTVNLKEIVGPPAMNMPIDMACKVVTTPWCTIPNDINYTLAIKWYNVGTPVIIGPIKEWFNQTTAVPPVGCCGPQFPWKKVIKGPDGKVVELIVEEVQKAKTYVLSGFTESCVQLGAGAAGYWASPYASRSPEYTPRDISNDITFSEKDPITGLVKLGVPAASYDGFDHTYYSPRFGTYFTVHLLMKEQGCGYLFTGDGKDPIAPDVDIWTYTNDTGTYNYGKDGIKDTADDLPCILDPCLQSMSGLDGIPGTGNLGDCRDCFGDGVTDPPGSAILYMPLILWVEVYDGTKFVTLFTAPWPLVMTTATAHNMVQSGAFTGEQKTLQGHPMEYVHSGIPWKNPTCNIWTEWAAAWAVLNTPTVLGPLDVLYVSKMYSVRSDYALIGDVDCSYKVDGSDILIAAGSFLQRDEKFAFPVANSKWNVRADVDFSGKIDGSDILIMAANFLKSVPKLKAISFPSAKIVKPAVAHIYNCTTYYFDASTSSDPDGYIEFYHMSWVRGVANPLDPTSFGFCDGSQTPSLPAHFLVPGTYTVTLWVCDNQGFSAYKSITVLVERAP